MPFIWILIAVVAIILVWAISVFNSLISKSNRSKNAWSDVDVQLKRRYDLIPNLVETVKGYSGFEAATLEKVTLARSQAMGGQSGDIATRAQTEMMLGGALKSMLAIAESYPQLKASENFQKLQAELSNLENDIQSARKYYNATVRELNNAIQVFPANLIAGMLGFKRSEFFGAEENERAAVNVSF